MKMENKLHYFRIHWSNFLKNQYIADEYHNWIKTHKYIKQFISLDRRVYYFFLNTRGRDWIKRQRLYFKGDYDLFCDELENTIRIIKTSWIKKDED